MQQRTLQSLIALTNDTCEGTTSDINSAAIALALCRYIDLTNTPLDPHVVKMRMVPFFDVLTKYVPLNIPVIETFAYQLHQYRHSVLTGYFPNARGSTEISWLFGLSSYASGALLCALTHPDFIQKYRAINHIMSDISTELANASFV